MMRDQSRKEIFCCGPLEIDLDRREIRSAGAEVSIGSRAFAIIEILVQSAGEVVNKRDLMRQVWPGTFVEENSCTHTSRRCARRSAPSRAAC